MTAPTGGAVVVLGAGGHGKSVIGVLLAAGRSVECVLDDDPATWGTEVQGVPVAGPLAEVARFPGRAAVAAIGGNGARRAVVERFPGTEWTRVVYPGAYLNPTASIGVGTVVFPGALVGADVVVGAHVVLSGHTTLGHDAVLGDYAQVAPGVQVAGGVRVGEGALLAIGSIVCPGVRIGAGAVLGAGAVAVRDVPDGAVAFGVPAKPR